jgi:ABC-type transporter Mla MlaB component
MLETVAPGHYRLQGKFTMQEGTGVLRQLLALASDKHSRLHQLDLDVGALEAADSVLLAAILAVARQVEKQNGKLRITGLSDSMRGLARVYGVDTLIERYQLHS